MGQRAVRLGCGASREAIWAVTVTLQESPKFETV